MMVAGSPAGIGPACGRARQYDEHENQNHEGERDQGVDETHQRCVDAASLCWSRRACRRAFRIRRDADDQGRHEQVDAASGEGAHEEIAADRIGANGCLSDGA